MTITRFFALFATLLAGILSFTGAAMALDGNSVQFISPGNKVETLTLDEIEAMGLDRVETTTTWTDGKQVFEGVLLSRLVERFGGESTTIVVRAINDYEAEIDVAEVRQYDVLLAVRQNGERMTVREKGPGWIVYPRDDHDELADERHNFKWVWQVGSIAFQ